MMNDWHQLKSIIRETVRQVVRAELEKAMAAQNAEILEMLEQLLDRPAPDYSPSFSIETQDAPESQSYSSETSVVAVENNPEQLADILLTLSHEIETIDQPKTDDNPESHAISPLSLEDQSTSTTHEQTVTTDTLADEPLDLSPYPSPTGSEENLELNLESDLAGMTESWNLEQPTPELSSIGEIRSQTPVAEEAPEGSGSSEIIESIERQGQNLGDVTETPSPENILENISADTEASLITASPETIDISTLEQKRQELLRQLAELEKQAVGLGTSPDLPDIALTPHSEDSPQPSEITGIGEFTVEENLLTATESSLGGESSLEVNLELEANLSPAADVKPPDSGQEEVAENPDDNLDETDRLLNEFADQEESQNQQAQESIAIPEPTYNPTNPWFLGVDCYDKCLSLALTDTLTRRTYNLQFASTNRSNYLPLGEDWQLDQCWDTTIPQALQNSYEQKVQDILAKVIPDLRHPQLPTSDMPLIFENLRGIIVSLPIGCSAAHGVKFRQALLQAGWATRPESILVIDRTIAPLLAVIEQQKEVRNIYHLSIHCTDEYTTIALSVKPLASVNLPYGYQFVENTLKETITKNIFNHISDPDTVKYLVNICQAHFQEPSQQKWEYEWQNQRIPVDRSQLDHCQQIALRQWLELVGPHINQFLSQLPDHTPAQIWLMGKLPIGFWEWLSGKLAPARPQILHEQAVIEGLAVAPFWREYLDIVKLQYSDYFLIHEICALRLPDPCTFNTITDALLQRGVNVKACIDQLQQIINQGVPSHLGLVQDTRGSQLFRPTPDGKLSPCRDNMLMVRSHLQQLQYGLRQNLAEPLVFPHYP